MAKEDKSIWEILAQGLQIYCLNIHKFLLYMAFPVLGQILGLGMIFGATYWFTQNYQNLVVKYSALNDLSTMMIFTIILIIPGLLVWMKAFLDYLIAYGALNSLTEGYLNTGKVYDFQAHNATVTNKTFSFLAVWFLFGIFTTLAIIPVFWILGFVFFVYFILVFQVFTFENGLSPIGYYRRSLQLIKGNFSRTFLLMAILVVFTYFLLSSGLSVLFDSFNLTQPLTKIFEAWAFTLPLEHVERFGITPTVVAKNLVQQLIFVLVVGFTLPLRSICYTLWYNNFTQPVENKEKPVRKKTTKKSTKKSSKDLPKSFKIEKRGIDPEIIRRARLEDDEY